MIALGVGLVAAAEYRIPSCPMGGFDPQEVGKIINIEDHVRICALLALGPEPAELPPFAQFRHIEHLTRTL